MKRHPIVRQPTAIALGAVWVALSLWFCAPMFDRPDAPGINDWDQHLFYYAAVIKSVVEYGQPPFWNPWYCGGNVLWANPQVPLLSPAFPLAAVVSLPLAMKINIVLHYVIGLAGMHLLLRRSLGVRSTIWTLYLSVAAIFSGAMAMHLNVGHSVFLPCLYIPLQLHFTIQAIRSGRLAHASCAAIPLALMIYNGALHVVPMSVAALALFAAATSLIERRWRPLVVAGVVIGLGFALAGPKLVPVVQWVTSDRFMDARTVLERPDQMTIEMLSRAYLDPFQHRGLRFDLQRSGWYEYGNYIGGLAAWLIAASVLWALAAGRFRGQALGAGLAASAAVLLALSAGEFSAWAPASLATHVPLFSSFRIPSRYTIVFVTMGVATVAWVVSRLEAQVTLTRAARIWIGLVCILAAGDLVRQNRGQFRNVFPYEPLAGAFKPGRGVTSLDVDTTSDPYAPNAPMLRVLMSDRAFFNCYESLQTPRSARQDWPLIASDRNDSLFESRFSPNRVEFAVAGGRETTHVVLNQNFAHGWRSSAGPVVPSPDGGRPSVDLAPGQTGRFEFSYVPPGLLTGTMLFVVAVGVVAFTWRLRLPGGGESPDPAMSATL